MFGDGIPLWWDEDHQAIRVVGTRLKLEAIVRVCNEGYDGPEEVVQNFDVLTTEMAERIVDWCRGHPAEVRHYMRHVEKGEEAVLAQLAPRLRDDRKRRRQRRAQQAQAQAV